MNSKQVAATPANKFDIRHGPLTVEKIMLLADWAPPLEDPSGGWFRTGKPTQTFWRAWKLRKKSIFAAGLSLVDKRVLWKSKEPFPDFRVQSAIPAVRRASRAVPAPRKAVRLRNTSGLLPWQPGAVARHILALERHGGSLEASTTGVGKTFIALAVARELDLRPMVVCPKNIISGWERAAEALGVQPYFVTNYEQVKAGNLRPFIVEDNGKFTWSRVTKKGTNQNRVMAIFDEAHRLKNPISLNSQIALGARLAGIPTMQLSATIAQEPTDLCTTGLLLNLHKGGEDYIRWAQEYGCVFDGMGLVYRGTSADIKRLHHDLFPERGSRIRSGDLEDFPESLVIAKSLDCGEEGGLLQGIYDEMEAEMERHSLKLEMDGMKLLNMLCQMTRARQHAELLKVPAMCELIENLVQEGHSVPVFVNYSETLDAINERMGGPCSIIRGGQSKKQRDYEVEQFQLEQHRVILCQIRAGGESISLHDTTGRFPRASVISPGFSAREVIQACGRTPRAGAQSKCLQYVIFAHGTIEDAACRRVERMANNIEQLNDGDLAAGFKIPGCERREN